MRKLSREAKLKIKIACVLLFLLFSITVSEMMPLLMKNNEQERSECLKAKMSEHYFIPKTQKVN